MTGVERERAAGIQELRRVGGAGRDPKDTIGWRNWVLWCDANQRPEAPEQGIRGRQLMLFLLHNHEVMGWRRDTCAKYALEVSRVWSLIDDARTLDTDALLAWMGKQPHSMRPAVSSFEPEQVLALGAALQVVPTLPGSHQPPATDIALAALLALADIVGVSPFQRRGTGVSSLAGVVWGQEASAFDNQGNRIVFTYDGRRFLIYLDRHPEHFHAVSTALSRAALLPGDLEPLVKLWPQLPTSSGASHKSAVLNAWVRAVTQRAGRDPRRFNVAGHRNAFQEWWDNGGPAERAWCISVAGDRLLVRRRFDLAYFYTGITTALRHATLCRLVLDEIEVRPEGLVIHVPPTKHKSGNTDLGKGGRGEWLHKAVAHHRADGGDCVDYCPACAFLAHLAVRRRHGACGTDHVFPPLQADSPRLSRPAGTAALRRVWDLADEFLGNPERKVEVVVGTRSLRVSAATLARLGKLPLSTIQRLLDHRDSGVTELYIRIHDPYAEEDLVLTVRPPAALAATAQDE